MCVEFFNNINSPWKILSIILIMLRMEHDASIFFQEILIQED